MKKISIFLVLALLAFGGSAFALSCETSMSGGGADACWTNAVLSNNVSSTTLAGGVSAGTVMVYDIASGMLGQSGNATTLTLAQTGATVVKPATVSADGLRVAGVLQVSLDPNKVGAGSSVRLLVRGLGDIIISSGGTAVASGDALVVRTAGQAAAGLGMVGEVGNNTTNAAKIIATALEAQTANTQSRKKAIIYVV